MSIPRVRMFAGLNILNNSDSKNKKLFIFLILLINFNLNALDINLTHSNISILPYSQIFVDKTNFMNKEDLKEEMFHLNTKDVLGYGFVPNTSVWIKFTLHNKTNQFLSKVLEYDNPETEEIFFYDGEKKILDGMWHIDKNTRRSINPIFNIILKPFETKEYYLRVHSDITTLIVKLTLWNEEDFHQHDYRHKLYIFMFFSAMIILFLYNTMLFVFTKDKAYFYYISYLIGVIFFESIYLGVAQLYFLSNSIATFITQATIGYLALLVAPTFLFTMEFLNTKVFVPNINRWMQFILYMLPFLVVLSFNNMLFNQNIMIVFLFAGMLLVFVGIYSLYKNVQQAKYYVVGWSLILSSLLLSILESLGIFTLQNWLKYSNEIAFLLEALLFSIALAHRIKLLNDEKEQANIKLIAFQENEKTHLKKIVKRTTKELKDSLEEKELLYQELSHRVRNNMAMVLSLTNLQISNAKNEEVKDALYTMQNRIKSVAQLYDQLELKEKNIDKDTTIYFKQIKANIEQHFEKNIMLRCDVSFHLDLTTLIYCGQILNELITNSYKYAFESSGVIDISLKKEEGMIEFIVRDDGVGFQTQRKNSLGLKIIKNLVEKQLLGEIKIISNEEGTIANMRWKENLE